MSSNRFEVTLYPDRRVQLRFACIGLVALGLGLALICLLPIGGALHLTVSIAWLLASATELWRWYGSVRSLVSLRFASGGEIHGLFRNGICRVLRILPGSRIMGRQVWLRLGDESCEVRGVLLTSGTMDARSWRRLQVTLRLSRQPG